MAKTFIFPIRKTLILTTFGLGLALGGVYGLLLEPVEDGLVGSVKVAQPKKQPVSRPKSKVVDAPVVNWNRIFKVPLLPISVASADRACCQLGNLGLDEQVWGENGQPGDRQALLKAIDYSLQYLQTEEAGAAYRRYGNAAISRNRVWRSLSRFRELLLKSRSPQELQASVRREFVLYQSVGRNGLGNVVFSAYYEPIYQASRVLTKEYRYPVYRLPPDLASWPRPHPTREELEGQDGLQGAKGKLRGLELFWLRDRLDAFLAQVEGSARLQLTDGSQTTIGYAGNTAYNYTSIGRELAKDGKLPLEGMTLPLIIKYFNEHPAELNNYLPRNRGMVFFQENHGVPAMGCLSVPVTGERSIATDKSLMPPGALALIHAEIPFADTSGQMEYRTVSRYVLDQDTGGAIQGPGRVDYFLGSGDIAGERAGLTVSNGELYYLLLKQ